MVELSANDVCWEVTEPLLTTTHCPPLPTSQVHLQTPGTWTVTTNQPQRRRVACTCIQTEQRRSGALSDVLQLLSRSQRRGLTQVMIQMATGDRLNDIQNSVWTYKLTLIRTDSLTINFPFHFWSTIIYIGRLQMFNGIDRPMIEAAVLAHCCNRLLHPVLCYLLPVSASCWA